ncbi:MAG TPA: ATP-grasp domain-containing protein [Candidatus Dormibacteraeota bacterium]
MPPRLLLVLPTRTYRAQAFLDAATRAGIEVAVASDEPGTLAALTPGRELVVDLGSPAEAGPRAARFAEEHPLAGVVGVDESAVLTAAHVAERLGLRHHPVAAVAATRDKRRLRAVFEGAGLPQPRWVELRSDADGAERAQAVAQVGGYPVVVKPVDLAASRGVIRADDATELGGAVERVHRLLARLECAPDRVDAAAHPLLLEEFVPGAEVAVEGLVINGRVHVLAVFDKPDPLDGPYFAETIYTTPSRHRPATRAQIVGLTAAAASALGLRDGPLHAELRLPLAGPVLLEVAARSIGGLCSRTLRLGPGGTWSLEELILRHAAGEALGDADLAVAGAASGVLMLPVARAGRLRAVTGVEAAAAVPGIDGVNISVAPGTPIEPLPEGDRYVGFVFARAATPLEVEVALRRAWQHLTVVTD